MEVYIKPFLLFNQNSSLVEQRRATLRPRPSTTNTTNITRFPSNPPRPALQALNQNVPLTTTTCMPIPPPPQQQPDVKPPLTSTASQRLISDLSFANIQFEHTYRVSSKCLNRMLALYIGVVYKTTLRSPECLCGWKPKSKLDMYAEITAVITSERFIDFLMKSVDAKLKNLNCYDPLGYVPLKTFKMLSILWTSFSRRINGSDGDLCVFKPDIAQRFCPSFLSRSVKMIGFCQSIWTLVDTRFTSIRMFLNDFEQLKETIKNARLQFQSKASLGQRENDVLGSTLICFMRTIRFHLSPSSSSTNLASKCCSSLLNLIHSIVSTVELATPVYTHIHSWLLSLAERPVAEDDEVGKSIFRLVFLIASRHDLPLITLKHLTSDMANYASMTTAATAHDRIEQTLEFKVLNKPGSLIEYMSVSSEAVMKTCGECRWLVDRVEFGEELFDKRKSLRVLCKLINDLVIVVENMLRAVMCVQAVDVCLRPMIEVYQLLDYIFKSVN